MHTVLINPPWFCLMGRSSPGMPLGLACMAATLRTAGHHVTLFDADAFARPLVEAGDNTPRAFFHDAASYENAMQDSAPLWDTLARSILEYAPRIIGITIWSGAYPATMALCRSIKRLAPHVHMIAGGAHATLAPETLLLEGAFDYVVCGEGEEAGAQLWHWLDQETAATSTDGMNTHAEKKNALPNIPGIWGRFPDGSIHDGGRSPLIANLDALPPPDYEGIVPEPPSSPVAGIITARGCPFRCGFCASEAIWTARVRYRSIDSVLDELVSHHQRFGLTQFRINDDSFCLKRDRVEAFCSGLTQRFGAGVMTFWIDANESTLDESTIRLLEKAGCRFIAIGIESVAPRIREAFIRKKVDLDHARELFAFINTTRILGGAYFMTGFPEETEEELLLTLNWMRTAKPANPMWGVLAPYPGTELHTYARDHGILPQAGFEHFMHHSVKTSMANIAPERHARLMEQINAESDALTALHRRRIARMERCAWLTRHIRHPLTTMHTGCRLVWRKLFGSTS